MALKPGRDVYITDISYFATAISGPNTLRMERGFFVVADLVAPASGEAMDSSSQAIAIADNASGRIAVGCLDTDVVNIDQSRQILNNYKEETQIGNKVCIIKKGWVVTNAIMAGQGVGAMPTGAYISQSGRITDVSGAGLPLVGRFMSRVDADGYAKVFVDLA